MYQLGLIRQKTDERDYKLPRLTAADLPRSVDLRAECPPVFDQGELGSCTANAGAAAKMMLDGTPTLLSRRFLYYQERVLNGTVMSDTGATMRDLCKALNTYGVCEEKYCPYSVSRYKNKPIPQAYRNALNHKINSYATFDGDTADDVQQIRQYLFTVKKPVLLGLDVYESFMTEAVAKTGRIPMPKTDTEKLIGGHAVLVVGYSDTNQTLTVRNSWGAGWGDKGYFYLPYQYLERKLAFDSWTISM